MSNQTWYKRIIQTAQPSEPTLRIENEPEWVGNILRELTQQLMPAFHFQKLEKISPQDLGRLVGQHQATLAAVKKSNFKDAEVQRGLIEPFNGFARDIIAAAWNEASQEERAAFFRGMAEGLSKPGIVNGTPARATTATAIYQILLYTYDRVKQLKSVRELREHLLKSGLSEQMLGRPKRLEKLCQRLGLSFAEPGRPKRAN